MNNVTTQIPRTAPEEEKRLRASAVRAGVASARIEGGDVGPDAQAIMNEWAQGLIDNDTMTARIDALHAA